MKTLLVRGAIVCLLVFFQVSFLDILFPWFHVPLLIVASIVSWTLLVGFPASLWITVPLCLLFDLIIFGSVSGLSLYGVALAYATSFVSRRLMADRQGAGAGVYALFAAGAAVAYQLLSFFYVSVTAPFPLTGLPLFLPPSVLLFSLVLTLPLFVFTHTFLGRVENRLALALQKQFVRVR